MAKGTPKGAKRPVKKAATKKPSVARSSGAPAPVARPRPAAQRTRQEKEKRALRNRLIAGAVLLVVIGVVVFSAVSSGDDSSSAVGPLDEGAGDCTLDSKADDIGPNGVHISNPTYKVEPPAGGSHLSSAANPGFYRESNVPPDGQLVHAMEHGFVVLWHRPDLPAEKLDQIEALSDRLGRELIVAPRPSLEGEVVVTAWNKRLLCGELVPEKVAEFSRLYRDKGPEKGFL